MKLSLPSGSLTFRYIVGGEWYRFQCDSCYAEYQSKIDLPKQCIYCSDEDDIKHLWDNYLAREYTRRHYPDVPFMVIEKARR